MVSVSACGLLRTLSRKLHVQISKKKTLCLFPVARSSPVATLCTSGFTNDVVFLYNGSYGGVLLRQHPRCSVYVRPNNPAVTSTGRLVSWMTEGARTRRVLRARGAGRSLRCSVALFVILTTHILTEMSLIDDWTDGRLFSKPMCRYALAQGRF